MKSYPKTPPRDHHSEKNLIADQPGRLVLFGGVILSLIIGFSIRGLTSPGKVKAMVETAASKIHQDVQVQFSGASLSFSRGLLPRFAVVIQNVRMESANECWMSPRLIADEIRLPLSLWALVQGDSPVTKVEAGQVEITLRKAYKNCETVTAPPVVEEPRIKQFVTLKTTSSSETQSAPPPQVDAILIDQLKIAAPGLDEPIELSKFGIRLKSNSPRVIEVTAQTHLMRDPQVLGDYFSHASIWSEYTEFPKKSIQARLSGNWREGSYQLKASYLLKEEELSTELDLKHIPLNQVSQIFKKFSWLNEDLNARQVWVSLNAQATGQNGKFKEAVINVKDLRLEGDLGDITSSHLRITSLEPLAFAPFSLDLQRVSIEKILALGKHPHPSPVLGQLGYFSGTADIKDADHIEVNGTHSGLEFIFANKGQREVQTLREVTGKISLNKDHWSLDVSRFVPDQGVFDGDVQVSADKKLENVEIKAKAKQLTLAPAVVRLMTAGGKVGSFHGDLNLKLLKGRMSSVKGSLSADDIDVEGVRLEKSKLNFDSHKDEVLTQVQVQRMDIRVGSPAFQLLKDMIEPEWMKDDALTLRGLSTQFRSKELKTLSWKNFQAQVLNGRVGSDGAWDDQSYLSGQITTKTAKSTARWIIGGKRDFPVFSKK